MITPGSIDDDYIETDGFVVKRSRSSLTKIVSILMAVVITASLLIGFLIWRKQHEERVRIGTQQQAKVIKPVLPLKVQVYMDEAIRKGTQATISGTVHNISNEALSNISLEVELTRRKDAATDLRIMNVDPKELAPNQKGKYSLTLTGDYSSIKILSIKSGANSTEIGFKKAPGTPRPMERPHEPRTIIVNRPSAPKQGEEFINTPDNPAKIP